MIKSIILGIVFVALGLLPIYTPISLWWLSLGIPLFLVGLVFFLYAYNLRQCYKRILEGDEEALKGLTKMVIKLKNKIE